VQRVEEHGLGWGFVGAQAGGAALGCYFTETAQEAPASAFVAQFQGNASIVGVNRRENLGESASTEEPSDFKWANFLAGCDLKHDWDELDSYLSADQPKS